LRRSNAIARTSPALEVCVNVCPRLRESSIPCGEAISRRRWSSVVAATAVAWPAAATRWNVAPKSRERHRPFAPQAT